MQGTPFIVLHTAGMYSRAELQYSTTGTAWSICLMRDSIPQPPSSVPSPEVSYTLEGLSCRGCTSNSPGTGLSKTDEPPSRLLIPFAPRLYGKNAGMRSMFSFGVFTCTRSAPNDRYTRGKQKQGCEYGNLLAIQKVIGALLTGGVSNVSLNAPCSGSTTHKAEKTKQA